MDLSVRIIFLFFVVLFFARCKTDGQHEKTVSGQPAISFDQNDFDFGKLSMGEKVSHSFTFENTGKGNLYIKEVKADCGCTAVDFKREAIVPGEESSIEVSFDSNGQPGSQFKQIKVYSNASEQPIVLMIAAMVDYELVDN